MPLKPRPKAPATTNSPISFCVSRKAASAPSAPPTRLTRAQSADPVGQHPPELPADERAGQHHRQHRRAMRAAMPRSPQNATRWEVGTAIGMQQKKPATQISAIDQVWRQAEYGA